MSGRFPFIFRALSGGMQLASNVFGCNLYSTVPPVDTG